MGKLTIYMAIFNGYVSLPEGNPQNGEFYHKKWGKTKMGGAVRLSLGLGGSTSCYFQP